MLKWEKLQSATKYEPVAQMDFAAELEEYLEEKSDKGKGREEENTVIKREMRKGVEGAGT